MKKLLLGFLGLLVLGVAVAWFAVGRKRMKELAVQSSSGQFSSTERSILDSEFQALKQEITRISNDTEFNGTQLIAGGNAVFTTSQSATDSEFAGGGTNALLRRFAQHVFSD